MIVIIVAFVPYRSDIRDLREPIKAQALIPLPSIERLDRAILDRLAWSDEVAPNTMLVAPLIQHCGEHFGSMIDSYRRRQAVRSSQISQRVYDSVAGQREFNV